MDGKTHLKLGITSAIAATICSGTYIDTNEFILIGGTVVASLSSIVTSQLPDIDSKNSRISKIIPIVNWLKDERFLFLSFAICFLSFFCKYNNLFNNITAYSFQISIIMFCLYAFAKIFLKHRKLTHCLLSCLFVSIISFYPYYEFKYLILFYIGIGLSAGYISHIFYDCLTTKGCPLFYPISDKPIKFAKLKSSKHGNIAITISYVIILISIIHYFNLWSLMFELIKKSQAFFLDLRLIYRKNIY